MSITTEWDVYVSGALSALSPEDYSYVTTKIYERVQSICQKIQLTCYLPYRSQKTINKGLANTKVWEEDYKRVVNCGAVVAYVGIPSFGVGIEIEMARTANVPVVLLFESNKQQELSRLVLGNPAIKYSISFSKIEDIDEKLSDCLIIIFSKKNLETEAYEKNWPTQKREELQRQIFSLEKSLQNRAFFRNLHLIEPISRNKWAHLGQEWDMKKGHRDRHLHDFAQP